MNLDQFVIENEARAYRQRRLERAEHERRLALLCHETAPFSGLTTRLAAHSRAAWRVARSALSTLFGAGFAQPPRASMTTGFRKEL